MARFGRGSLDLNNNGVPDELEPDNEIGFQDQGLPGQGFGMGLQTEPGYHDEFSRFRVNFEDEIENVKHELLQEEFDKKSSTWKLRTGMKPIINNTGTNRLLAGMKLNLNKNNVMSNLSESDVKGIAARHRNNVINLLFKCHDLWDVDRENMDFVVDDINNIVYCELRRAWRAGERSSIDEHSQRIEQVHRMEGNNPNPKGLSRLWR